MFYPILKTFADRARSEFGQIECERKQVLAELAGFVRGRVEKGATARLVFICTHNSRRSHLAQIWAWAASAYFGMTRVETFSGGTEVTAFNPRAVAALQRAGFQIQQITVADNPLYRVRFTDDAPPLEAFSKVYGDSPNPVEDFCAVMTCASADRGCPFVAGSAVRLAVPYDDPKAADFTPGEAAAYDARSRQICCEMFYVFWLARQSGGHEV